VTSDAQGDQVPLDDDGVPSGSSESDGSDAVSTDAADQQHSSDDGDEQVLTVEALVTTLEVSTAGSARRPSSPISRNKPKSETATSQLRPGRGLPKPCFRYSTHVRPLSFRA